MNIEDDEILSGHLNEFAEKLESNQITLRPKLEFWAYNEKYADIFTIYEIG